MDIIALIKEKAKEVHFLTLVFVLLGIALLFIGLTEPTKVGGINISVKNELRIPSIIIGIFFISISLLLERRRSRSGKQTRDIVTNQPENRSFIGSKFYLEVKNTDFKYPLDGKRTVSIGSGKSSDLKIKDDTVDSYQAVIYIENGRYKICNRSARMPTYINDSPVTVSRNLGNNNTIRMGRVKLIFRENKE